jgi:adenine-specific DNA-methyltransferase
MKSEIDVLFDKKIFTNCQKHDKQGSKKILNTSFDDNLVIKGNNLLVLHALKEKYNGKVKLMY